MKKTLGVSSAFKPQVGFSIVEVTLALGVIAFALVSVVGLMPVGLATMRQAMDQTAEAQIVQQVASEAMLTPFSSLDAFAKAGPYCFDDQGMRQKNRDSKTTFEARVARVTTVYPGSDEAGASNLPANIATFSVEILRGSGTASTTTYVIHVPDSGN